MGLRWSYTVVVAVVVGLVVGGGYGFPVEDLVKSLPGQPNVTFRQYAGYVDVDGENGRSLFYYFVEAEENPDEKPLTLWFNGGPGCSSIGGGAFSELGPFFPRADGRGLKVNSKSWNKVSNLLFVESPAGVGWSYSNKYSDYNTADENTARDMYKFLLIWYNKFRAFRTRELFLAGESYAGHYIPQLAILLLNHNAHSPDPFNLQGIALGNPLLKVNPDVPAVYDYLWSHGLISDEIKLAITKECDFDCYSYAGTNNATQYPCLDALNEAFKIVGDYADFYGVIYDVCYPSIVEQQLRLRKMATKMSLGVDVCKMEETAFYLNLHEVQKALHANRTNLPYNWSDCSGIIDYSLSDGDIDMIPLLRTILKKGIRVFIYSGDQDSIVPLLGTRTIVRELAHDLKFNISVPYGAWFHKGQVGGWQTVYGKLLTFITVKGAAHMVPYSQPSKALHFFTSFVRGRTLPNTTRIPI
ncbi:Serine carboxypeptidase-like 42 [Orobanche hederae]